MKLYLNWRYFPYLCVFDSYQMNMMNSISTNKHEILLIAITMPGCITILRAVTTSYNWLIKMTSIQAYSIRIILLIIIRISN